MNPARKVLVAGALAGTALIGGAVGASFLGSAGAATNATNATNPTSASTATRSSSAPANRPPRGPDPSGRPAPDWNRGGHQANGKTEALLSGTAKSNAVAAAEAAVPGATAQRAETDADGATYEVHMTKSDGSVTTVKLDANFAVARTIDGMG